MIVPILVALMTSLVSIAPAIIVQVRATEFACAGNHFFPAPNIYLFHLMLI
jgi:hypothetical protein